MRLNLISHRMRILGGMIVLFICLPFPCDFIHADSAITPLNLWNIPPSWCRDPERKSQYVIFSTFRQQNPDIRIEMGQGLVILGPAAQSAFLMAMAGGTAPDAFITGLGGLPAYAEQGLVMPLDELFASWPEKERVPPILLEAGTVNGKLYGLATSTRTLGLIYRKDYFQEAGLDPNHPPEDWAQLLEYSRRLTDPEKGRFGIGCRPADVYLNLLWAAGGELVREDANGRLHAAFNSDEGVRALEFIRDLHHSGGMRPPARDIDAPSTGMAQGMFAMVFGVPEYEYQYLLEKLQEYQIGVAAMPAGPAKRVSVVTGEVWCINGTLNPEREEDRRKIEAAWRYITYNAGREAAKLRTEVYVEYGGPQFLDPQLLKEFGYDYYLDRIDPSVRQLYEQIRNYGRVEPRFPGIAEFGVILRAPIEAVLANPNTDCRAVLNAAARRVDREVFARREGKVEAWKERLASLVVILLALMFVIFFIKSMHAIAEKVRSETRTVLSPSRQKLRLHLVAWALMIPALASILIWQYIPLGRGSLMAFQDFHLQGGSEFIGLKSFIHAFTSRMFYQAMLTTFYYVFLSLVIGFPVPIFLAILLSEVPHGKVFFRVLFFLPAITSGLVILFLWRWFYQPTEAGLFNTLLLDANLVQEPVRWLEDKRLAMLCIILPGVWAGAGPGSIIYLAALKSVPNDIYEAADVDGAGTWSKVWNITFPSLKALILINFIGAFIGSFHAMQNIFVMTGGGPENSTYTIGLDIFYNAFVYLRFGYATALAWILGSLLIGFTVIQLRVLKQVRFEAGKGEA